MAKGGFRPGSGRKKGYKAIAAEKAREYLVKRIADELDPITSQMIAAAKSGDQKAAEYLMNQIVGKAKETVEHSGKVSVLFDE
jgi:hypothetical protein